MEQTINTRQLAMQILLDVEQNKKFLNDALHTTLKRYQYLSKQERAFLTRLCEGTVEYQIYLDYVIDAFSKTKVSKCKPVIRVILRMAVYQICFMNSVPEEAACNEAVKLAKKKGFHQLTGFVNGVLRNIVRGRNHIIFPEEQSAPEQYLSVMYSMPLWLVKYLLEYYDYDIVKGMLKSFMEEHPACIRVNTSKTTVADLRKRLQEQGIAVDPGHYVEHGLRISNYNYMRRVPGFSDGDFSVQDESSMLAGLVTSPEKGAFVLDVCGAPGGKSMDIADRLAGTGQVISRDVSKEKLEKISENLERMGFSNVALEQWDGTVPDARMFGRADYVICDVPCSGMGVMGRKKDIKYHLTRQQLDALVTLQRSILGNAWKYLKPGGVMIFSTCTLNPKENEENFKWLTETFPLVPENLDSFLPKTLWDAHTKEGYLKLIPGIHDTDGFFLSRLRRKEAYD